MALAIKDPRQSTIKFIEQGKEWQGKNGGQKMQEYKPTLKFNFTIENR